MIMHDVPGDTQYICTPYHANPSSTTEYHDTHPPDSVNYEKILIILPTVLVLQTVTAAVQGPSNCSQC